MKRFGEFEPGEEDLPEGWEPERDRDTRWDAMVELLKQADEPVVPTPSSFEVMKFETRRQLLEEGLLNLQESRASERRGEMTFREWVRLLLSGGGLPAQSLRLAFVGGGAFLLGVQYLGTQPVGPVAATTTAPAAIVASATKPAAAELPAELVDDTQLADASTVTPRRAGGLPPEGFAIERGGWGRSSMASPLNTMGLLQQSGGNGALAVSSQAVPDRALASQAIDQLQVLKVDPLIAQDDRKMSDVRKLERTLTQLMQGMEPGEVPEIQAVNLYRRAEQYLSAGRYHEAQDTLQHVAAMDPGSSLAYLAQFQTGWIAFEKTHDYRLAQETFRRCLENYPEQSDRHRAYLEDRTQLIAEGEAEQWKSLTAWQKAEESATNEEAAKQLMQVMSDTTSPLLAAKSALGLSKLLVADGMRRDLDHEPIMAAMRTRLQAMTPSPEAAAMQFALADIVARRLQNPTEAIREYEHAAALQPDAQTARAIESRLSSLHQLRLSGALE